MSGADADTRATNPKLASSFQRKTLITKKNTQLSRTGGQILIFGAVAPVGSAFGKMVKARQTGEPATADKTHAAARYDMSHSRYWYT